MGISVWYDNWQFHVFLTSFFRSSGKNLSYVNSTAPTSVGGDFGLFLSLWELLKIAVFPKVRCCWIGFDFGVVRARINKMVTSNCVF